MTHVLEGSLCRVILWVQIPAPPLCSCITGPDIYFTTQFQFPLCIKADEEYVSNRSWQKCLSAFRPKNSSPSEQLVCFNLTSTVAELLMLTGCWEAESKTCVLPRANSSIFRCLKLYSCAWFFPCLL